MAQLVTMLGITHNPFMPKLFKQAQQPPGAAKVQERIAMMRAKLAKHKPDVLITIGNDHLHQFFMDNMPAFMIGKMDSFHGTFYDEVREFGLPECDLPGDLELCNRLLEGAYERGVDFAYSSELTIDHSIVVPMLFVRPEMDIPIVPILTNCIAPPLPTARRFYEVGKAVRSVIDSLPDDKRIGVLVSGHLSLEVGGTQAVRAPPYGSGFRRARRGLDRHRRHRRRGAGLQPGANDPLGQHDHGFPEFPDGHGRGPGSGPDPRGGTRRRLSRRCRSLPGSETRKERGL